jgi:hypothetical protein
MRAKKRVRTVCLTVAAVVLASSSVCRTETWNVPSEVGSIPDAVDSAAVGDTILVAPGTYVRPDNPDYSDSWITLPPGVALLSEAGAQSTVIVDSSLSFWPHRLVKIWSSPGCVVRGFTFLRGIGAGGKFYGIHLANCTGSCVDSCIFEGPFYSGVKVTGNADHSRTPVIQNCHFSNCGTAIECSYVSHFESPLIQHNTMIDNSWGITCVDAGPYIADNYITNCDYTGVYCEGRSPALLDRNVIVGNGEFGVYVITEVFFEPVMTTGWLPANGNSIYGNAMCDLFNAVEDQRGLVEATCTYWGGDCPDFESVVKGPGRVKHTPWSDAGHTRSLTPDDCPGATARSTWGSIKALFR